MKRPLLSLLFMRFDRNCRGDRSYLIFCDKLGFTSAISNGSPVWDLVSTPRPIYDRMAGVAKRLMWLEIDAFDQCGLHETSCL
jgi:hypothetical protein